MIFSKVRKYSLPMGALLALVGMLCFAGCEGKPTSAAGPEKHVGPPPKVEAAGVDVDLRESIPTDAVWAKAQWYLLTSPANTSRTTPPVRAAMMFDAETLYVAFVSDTVPPPAAPIGQDVLSVFLDTTAAQDGTEMVQVMVDATGKCSCTWIRMSTPALPKEDGSPEWSHTMDRIPNRPVTGLSARVMPGTEKGSPVWAAVVAIPLKNLPRPLVATAKTGDHWKVNLLRTITTVDTGSGVQQLQANLSPVYLGGQAVSPYRMAELELVAAK